MRTPKMAIRLLFFILIITVGLAGCAGAAGSYPAPVLGVVVDNDFVVADIQKASAAEQAGVQIGDVLLTLNRDVYSTPAEWLEQIGAIGEGQTYQITVQRGGDTLTLTVTSARQNPDIYAPGVTPTPIPSGLFYL